MDGSDDTHPVLSLLPEPPVLESTPVDLALFTAVEELLLVALAITRTAQNAVVLTKATHAVTSLAIRLVMATLVLHDVPAILVVLELPLLLALGTVPGTGALVLTTAVRPAEVVGSALLAVVLLPRLHISSLAQMRLEDGSRVTRPLAALLYCFKVFQFGFEEANTKLSSLPSRRRNRCPPHQRATSEASSTHRRRQPPSPARRPQE